MIMADRDRPPADRVLLVEGQDDKHVVLHFCMRNKMDVISSLHRQYRSLGK